MTLSDDAPGTATATADSTADVVPGTGQTFVLTTGPDTVNGGPNNNTIIAGSNTLSAGDQINGGVGGTNQLELTTAGTFNLKLPTTLTNVQIVNAQEGQAAFSNGTHSFAATNQVVTLRDGLNVTVDVTSALINPENPKPATITIIGANDASVINLANGNDVVTVGSAAETVHGGTGNDQIQVTASTIGATIDGGTGQSTLDVLGGGSVVMGATVTDISTVLLASTPSAMSFVANGTSGLVVDERQQGRRHADGGWSQPDADRRVGWAHTQRVRRWIDHVRRHGGGDQQRYDQQLPGERRCDRCYEYRSRRGGLPVHPGAKWVQRHSEHQRQRVQRDDDAERGVQCRLVPDQPR